MKIFSTEQIRQWDEYTIKNEDIDSLELMEQASESFLEWFTESFPKKENPIYIFCGNGNNGGDGLAIGRLLSQKSYQINILLLEFSDKRSNENLANLKTAKKLKNIHFYSLSTIEEMPKIEDSAIVIDALFGTGIKNKLEGFIKQVLQYINELKVIRIAVDIPSGLLGDSPSDGVVFNANYTFSFAQPKLAFLFPENYKYVGEWIAKPIPLSKAFYNSQKTDNYLLTDKLVVSLSKKRKNFEHKGNFGHALLIMGSRGKIGASVLSTLACMRSGAGLTTVYTPSCGYQVLQISTPEAMVITDENDAYISNIPNTDMYNAIGVGCGMGTEEQTKNALHKLLKNSTKPLVLDADALNSIASKPEMFSIIPKNSILTPHPKEFERLFGKTSNDFKKNQLQRQKAKELNCYILLKGANSCIATPEGLCYFNSTGNSGMATGGSGDVLTGIITGLLARGYSSETALLMGVYLHGLAGDLAIKDIGKESLIARDIIKYLPKAFIQMKISN